MAGEKEDPQYQAWGVVIQTSMLRAGHIANGIVQLLRLLPDPPRLSPMPSAEESRIGSYVRDVTTQLRQRYGNRGWDLSDVARAFCVLQSKDGPISLSGATDAPAFVRKAVEHLKSRIDVPHGETGLPRDMHELIAGALNADGRVMASGGNDPTTPGLDFAGYTSTHTLKGMHAATFLGLLCKTQPGCKALTALHRLLANDEDPHSQLVRRLGIGLERRWEGASSLDELRDLYPLPDGPDWGELSARAGEMASNLMDWSASGISKAQTLMSIVDLAALLLLLRLLRWRSNESSPVSPLLLMVSPLEFEARHHAVIARAQQNFKAALANLDQSAKERLLVLEGRPNPKSGKVTVYWPSTHAQNIGSASGWLYPLSDRGGPKRYLRPGSRQLTTLVHALVAPGQDVSWTEFAAKAQSLGLALGGPNEAAVAAQLRLRGGAFSLREAGRINRDHLVALGLARHESDNVVRVDGGSR